MIDKKRQSSALGVTDSALHPANFPVGSPQSRAAARMLAQQKENQRERTEVIISGDPDGPYASAAWTESLDGRSMRTLCVPDNMTIEEARQAVDQRH